MILAKCLGCVAPSSRTRLCSSFLTRSARCISLSASCRSSPLPAAAFRFPFCTTRTTSDDLNETETVVEDRVKPTTNRAVPKDIDIAALILTKKIVLPNPVGEADIEEKFVSGSGPGGQKINRSRNAVFLKHIPTGLTVKCQEFRALHDNRKRARRLLLEKIDALWNGPNSERERARQRIRKQKQRARRRSTSAVTNSNPAAGDDTGTSLE